MPHRNAATRPRHGPRGTALLDVIVALVILSSTGLALAAVVREAMDAERKAAREERMLDEADRLLAGYTLLQSQELDRRLGKHPQGRFTIDVQRPEPGLYRVSIADSQAPARPLLTTVVFPGTISP